MKFSEQWLREWVNPPINTETLLEQLTNAGLEVDSAKPLAAAFNKVVVAEVRAVSQHPNADRLKICSVDIGQDLPIIIVTNVADIAPHKKVAAALVGAKLPGLEIKQAALRGIDSFGMFCSAKTLGISDDDSGLLYLPDDAPLGEDLRKYLNLDDTVIDIELTPNRGDCLSIAGIAREVAVANNITIQAPAIKTIVATITDEIKVQVQAPEACPRYLCRVIRNIKSTTTPQWMQDKLHRSGLRSVHPVVDVTNYVMLEVGQPMHAFDLAKLNGGITVRYAEPGETLILLDDQELKLSEEDCHPRNERSEAAGIHADSKENLGFPPSQARVRMTANENQQNKTLVITDEKNVLALAGIMGGFHSGIARDTKDIVLEAAFFAPEKLLGKARHYGLHTDSSHRFERGVDAELPLHAIERASELLLQIVGGEAGPIVEKSSAEYLPKRAPIQLRATRIEKLLGINVAAKQVETILQQLQMSVTKNAEGWQVIPPTHRFDIAIEVDLIEEVARIYGFNNIPNTLPVLASNMLPQATSQLPLAELRTRLKNRAYQEAVCYSFVDPDLQKALTPDLTPLALSNPISSELSVMRTTLWAGLLPILQHNQKRQQERVRLFETGLRFVPTANGLQQISTIAGLVWGSALPEQWGEKSRAVDFYDVKADVESLLADKAISFAKTDVSALHPGRSAAVQLGDARIGYVGALHPELEQKLGLNGVYGFELDLPPVLQTRLLHYEAISKFPTIRRDLALLVDKSVKAETLSHKIAEIAGKLLNNLVIFDVYQGQGVPEGQKSIAIGIFLQAIDRTLVDEEVNQLIDKIVSALRQEFAAVIRGAN